ncbi:phosphoserine chloroplastic [Micractinium conductrix]|uniref:phosphoserine phosphatase n=1 Tax=Micractinium conductrix TaxID=554055 RepID=A0A2P6VSE5_9CHLO|nr:phosphoserine chloroplastic [Micractinium conductrix]|eukprot:PSC77028.1 phosphoserine chloroplastic [Micractinium conductrix]
MLSWTAAAVAPAVSQARPSIHTRVQATPPAQRPEQQKTGTLAAAAASAAAPSTRGSGARQQHWRCRNVVDGAASMTVTSSSDVDDGPALSTARAEAAAAGVQLQPTPELLDLLRHANAFTFDVDSTFCADESIDEIAAFLGVGEQVAALTAQAMGGSVLFQDALASRLGVMHPSRENLESFLAGHPPKISPGIPQLVAALRVAGKQVFLVSGGFRIVIHPIAESLGIPVENVFANNILFDHDGAYDGFDPAEFTSSSGGKREAVQHIKQAHGFSKVVMVGDGITDFEARAEGGADAFIGYGGVVYRENVAKLSDWYVFSIADITAALQQATTALSAR